MKLKGFVRIEKEFDNIVKIVFSEHSIARTYLLNRSP